jgi:hypothetical protein
MFGSRIHEDPRRTRSTKLAQGRVHELVIVSGLVLALLGQMPGSSEGWRAVGGDWYIPAMRGLAPGALWLLSGRCGPGWVIGIPFAGGTR